MITSTEQIAYIITASGQTGPQMTHALKVLGNGNMQQGLIRIAKYFFAEGKSYIKVGRLQGAVLGTVGGTTLTLATFMIAKQIKNRREKSKHDEEAEAIISAFTDNIPPEEGQGPETKEPDAEV